jgi:uncharacterized membrane protein
MDLRLGRGHVFLSNALDLVHPARWTNVVKRRALVQKISKAARGARGRLRSRTRGCNHSIYQCGTLPVVIARHNELNENTCRGIMIKLESD